MLENLLDTIKSVITEWNSSYYMYTIKAFLIILNFCLGINRHLACDIPVINHCSLKINF